MHINLLFCSKASFLFAKTIAVCKGLVRHLLLAKFHFRTIEVQEIRDAFAKVKTGKSFGIDNISSYFLKLALPFIENSLAFMFNTSIETSMFPDSWKIARVTPIYKNGDKADKSNYRPISVLPVISRLFEKLVTNQVYKHMKDNGLFSFGQLPFYASILL